MGPARWTRGFSTQRVSACKCRRPSLASGTGPAAGRGAHGIERDDGTAGRTSDVDKASHAWTHRSGRRFGNRPRPRRVRQPLDGVRQGTDGRECPQPGGPAPRTSCQSCDRRQLLRPGRLELRTPLRTGWSRLRRWRNWRNPRHREPDKRCWGLVSDLLRQLRRHGPKRRCHCRQGTKGGALGERPLRLPTLRPILRSGPLLRPRYECPQQRGSALRQHAAAVGPGNQALRPSFRAGEHPVRRWKPARLPS